MMQWEGKTDTTFCLIELKITEFGGIAHRQVKEEVYIGYTLDILWDSPTLDCTHEYGRGMNVCTETFRKRRQAGTFKG